MGIPFTHGSEAETPGEPGKWRLLPLLCCYSWTQFSSPCGTAFSSFGLWTGPATSQERATGLAVRGAVSLVPSGSNINTLTGEEGRAEFISKTRVALWKLLLFVALTSSEA